MSREGTRLHIGKLPEGTTKADLDTHFADFHDDVKDMWVARNPAGFAFIRVPEERVEAFIAKYDNSNFKDGTISVERARGERRPPARGSDRFGGSERKRGRDDDRDYRRRSDSRDRRRRSDSRDRRRRSDSRDRRRGRSESPRRRRSDSR